eukprot:4255908-Alexandrium_andersonii.AAC.1
MSASLVGSEMCIRDRRQSLAPRQSRAPKQGRAPRRRRAPSRAGRRDRACLLYTSDAADDM